MSLELYLDLFMILCVAFLSDEKLFSPISFSMKVESVQSAILDSKSRSFAGSSGLYLKPETRDKMFCGLISYR